MVVVCFGGEEGVVVESGVPELGGSGCVEVVGCGTGS